MKVKFLVPAACFFVLVACENKPAEKTYQSTTINENKPPVVITSEPSFNYSIEAPEGWNVSDTLAQGLKVRLIKGLASVAKEGPAVNILVSHMGNRNAHDFTTANMDFLRNNMAGVAILRKGNINTASGPGYWFTYTKEENGIVREAINYIIPANGFAYMITAGANKGFFDKYRNVFDKIAASIKI